MDRDRVKRFKWFTGCIVFTIACMRPCVVPSALAESPTEAIKETIDGVFTLLRNPALKGERKKEERRALLRETVAARFDFQEMAKRSLGPYWQQHAGKQNRFVALFGDLLGAVYLDTVEWGIEAEIFYIHERREAEYAEVDTKVVPSGKNGIEVSYRLHVINGEWKVYDVLVEHMSIVQNYRSQFYHILGRRTFDELIEMMRKKIETLRKLSRNNSPTPYTLDGGFFVAIIKKRLEYMNIENQKPRRVLQRFYRAHKYIRESVE